MADTPSDETIKKYKKDNPCRGRNGILLKGGHRARHCSFCRCCSACDPPPFCTHAEFHIREKNAGKTKKGSTSNKSADGASTSTKRKVGRPKSSSSSSSKKVGRPKLSSSSSSIATGDDDGDGRFSPKRKATTSFKSTEGASPRKRRIESISSESSDESTATTVTPPPPPPRTTKKKKKKSAPIPHSGGSSRKSMSPELEEACKLLQLPSYSKANKVVLLHSLILDLSRQICNGNSKEADDLIQHDLSPLLLNQQQQRNAAQQVVVATKQDNDALSTTSNRSANITGISPATATSQPPPPAEIVALEESMLAGIQGYRDHFERLSTLLVKERQAKEKLLQELVSAQQRASPATQDIGRLQERNQQLEEALRNLDEKHGRTADALSFQTTELQQEKKRRMEIEKELLELQEQEKRRNLLDASRNSITSAATRTAASTSSTTTTTTVLEHQQSSKITKIRMANATGKLPSSDQYAIDI
eukprot:scaffold174_cov98-Cylindrotheca_fusiformis.AAC.6